METLFLFDVDGTLTPARQKMTADFEPFFKLFCQKNLVYLVTGSNRQKLTSQISKQILIESRGAFTCSGAEFWIGDDRVNSREHDFDETLIPFIESNLRASTYPHRYGRHIEQRTGMINISVPGRNASIAQRKDYFEWDKGTKERDSLRRKLSDKFPKYEFFSGGQISIDVVPEGWNKAQIIPALNNLHPAAKIVFYGDRIHTGGNDEPLATALLGLNAGHIVVPVGNPRETFEKLQRHVHKTRPAP